MSFNKITLSFSLVLLLFSLTVSLNGCSQPQYVNDAELGKTVDRVPDLENRLQTYDLPEEIDDKDCLVERRILNNIEREKQEREKQSEEKK